jgi:UDP-N-acetylglucosamine--N-acetylmuramyl-(pentapeptide) pyrophosphoryl-undecaprenol N-acetylglucosamine transferase
VHEGRHAVVFAGGGTGGHLYPALALADALVALRPDVRPVFVGAERGLEARVLPARGAEHVLVPVRGFARGVGVLANLGVVPALARSLALVAERFHALRPELVVVTGGYAGAPAGVVAALTRVPLVLQEQNSVPGLVTRGLAPLARAVHVAFPEAVARLPARSRSRATVSGNPIRPPVARDAAGARADLGLDPALPVLLVVGGSQGSSALNRGVLDALAEPGGASAPAFQVLWATGPAHEQAVRAALAELGAPVPVRALGYLDDMPSALAAATLAVSRAGAMMTSELLAWGLPAILVPLPTAAADHQTHNARALAAAGAAVHIPEGELTGAALAEVVRGLMADPTRRAEMAAAARGRARPDSAERIARDLASFLPAPARRRA